MSEVDPLRSELLRPPAPGWRPEPGDVVIGEVVSLDSREGFAGVVYPIVELRLDDGTFLAVHAFHAVLRQELARQTPKVGDTLGIGYHGRQRKGDGEYELYRVRVVPSGELDPARRELDWTAIAAAAHGPEPDRGAEELDPDDLPF